MRYSIAATYDIHIEKGATWQFPLQWFSEGVPLMINDTDWEFRIRAAVPGGFEQSAEITEDYQAVFGVSNLDTAVLPVGEFRYQIEAEYSGGEENVEWRLLQGWLVIEPEVPHV